MLQIGQLRLAELTSPLGAGASFCDEPKPRPEHGVPHAEAPRKAEDHVTRRRLTGEVLSRMPRLPD